MSGRRSLGLLLLFCALASTRAFARPFVNPDRVEGDLAQHVWWTQRFEDASLFPGDPIAAFMSRPFFDPVGWQALYRGLAPAIGAENAARTLPFLLAVPTLLLAFLAGRRAARGRWAGGVAGAILCAATDGALNGLAWGLPRSFAPLLLYLGTWALLARRTVWFGASLLLGALFYPPSVVNLGLLGGIVLGVRAIVERALPPRWPWSLPFAAAALALLVGVYATPPDVDVGPKVTVETARAMPEFHPGGRSALFTDDPVRWWFHSKRSGIGMDPPYALAAVLAIVAVEVALRRRGRPPLPVVALLATSMAAFLVAHATLFALHLPNRYVSAAFPVFWTLWGASVAGRVADAWGARAAPRPIPGLAIAAGLLAAYGVFVVVDLRRHAASSRNPDRAAALAHLATLPVDTLVAAHPVDADLVPLRSRRSVLANQETSLPYWLGYYARVKPRVEASLALAYATRWEDVDALAREHGVDAVLVNAIRYEGPTAFRYARPFDEQIARLAARGREEGFALLHPPAERVLFRAGPYAVVRVGSP